MSICKLCCTKSDTISGELGVCLSCIRYQPEKALPLARDAHQRSRKEFGLPEEPPRDPNGALCTICVNECRVPEHHVGYCGLRRNEAGKLVGVSADQGKISWYYDHQNCTAGPACSWCALDPKSARCDEQDQESANLSVFFHACSFNCLFCRNWDFKQGGNRIVTPVQDLINDLGETSSCICYFGGDPTPQLPFAIKATRLARAKVKDRSLRVCWETSGAMRIDLLEEMVDLSLESGGCIKFDIKAWNDDLHKALTGVTNRWTLQNFKRAGEKAGRRSIPFLIASTLLVPGYIDRQEVRDIARFIASVDPAIPYRLLGFFPQFYLSDLPYVSREHAEECAAAAQAEGLTNVRIGNVTLLR